MLARVDTLRVFNLLSRFLFSQFCFLTLFVAATPQDVAECTLFKVSAASRIIMFVKSSIVCISKGENSKRFVDAFLTLHVCRTAHSCTTWIQTTKSNTSATNSQQRKAVQEDTDAPSCIIWMLALVQHRRGKSWRIDDYRSMILIALVLQVKCSIALTSIYVSHSVRRNSWKSKGEVLLWESFCKWLSLRRSSIDHPCMQHAVNWCFTRDWWETKYKKTHN